MTGYELARQLLSARWSGTGKDWYVAGIGFMRAWGTTVPADASTGYGKGCLFIHTDGETDAELLYLNVGDKDSADFNTMASVATAGTDFGDTGLTADVIAESTEGAGVTIDGLAVKDGHISLTDNTATALQIAEGLNAYLTFVTTDGGEKLVAGKTLETSAVIASLIGAAASAAAIRLGKTATEGFEVKVIDEDVTLTNAVEVDLTETVPAGAVILSVQGNLETAVVGDTTGDDDLAVVGVGTTADPDKYGKTSGLTKNLKVDTIPDWTVLSAEETVCVKAAKADGSAATEKFVADGVVRVRIVYAVNNSLDDAA